MKKTAFMLAICALMTACGSASNEQSTTDSVKVTGDSIDWSITHPELTDSAKMADSAKAADSTLVAKPVE